MPIFDASASNRAEADLLRGILGPAKPRDTSLRQASLLIIGGNDGLK